MPWQARGRRAGGERALILASRAGAAGRVGGDDLVDPLLLPRLAATASTAGTPRIITEHMLSMLVISWSIAAAENGS